MDNHNKSLVSSLILCVGTRSTIKKKAKYGHKRTIQTENKHLLHQESFSITHRRAVHDDHTTKVFIGTSTVCKSLRALL